MGSGSSVDGLPLHLALGPIRPLHHVETIYTLHSTTCRRLTCAPTPSTSLTGSLAATTSSPVPGDESHNDRPVLGADRAVKGISLAYCGARFCTLIFELCRVNTDVVAKRSVFSPIPRALRLVIPVTPPIGGVGPGGQGDLGLGGGQQFVFRGDTHLVGILCEVRLGRRDQGFSGLTVYQREEPDEGSFIPTADALCLVNLLHNAGFYASACQRYTTGAINTGPSHELVILRCAAQTADWIILSAIWKASH